MAYGGHKLNLAFNMGSKRISKCQSNNSSHNYEKFSAEPHVPPPFGSSKRRMGICAFEEKSKGREKQLVAWSTLVTTVISFPGKMSNILLKHCCWK